MVPASGAAADQGCMPPLSLRYRKFCDLLYSANNADAVLLLIHANLHALQAVPPLGVAYFAVACIQTVHLLGLH